MTSRAQHEAHKHALRGLADFIFEHKEKFQEQEYVQASDTCKQLHELADQLAQRSASAPANTRDRMAAQARSPSPESDQPMSDLQHFVEAIEGGERPIGDLVGVLRGQDLPPDETRLSAAHAIRELLDRADTEQERTDMQTALGAAGAISALVEWLPEDDGPLTGTTSAFQQNALSTLKVLISRHEGNKTLLGRANAFPKITLHMRDGAMDIECLAIEVLGDAGFQHAANQRRMRDAGTAHAIVHLASQVRPLDRIRRLLGLLQKLLCSEQSGPSSLAMAAADAGIVPLLLSLLGSGIQDQVLDVLYKVYDDSTEIRDQVVREGGIEKVTDVLLDEDNTIDVRARAARALGELGSKSFPNRAKMRELGVIAVLKELVREPSGRRRAAFAFGLSRLDEEGDGLAALEVKRKKQLEEREAVKKTREQQRKEIEERIKATPAQLRKSVATPIAKKRARK